MSIQPNLPFLRALARRLVAPARTRVLIVDPDQSGARMLAAALPRRFSVTFAATASEARAALATEPFDLAVIELHLPDGAGIDLFSSLRQGAATSSPLLMVMATQTSVREKIAVLLAGADDFLIKPVTPAQFADHVQRLTLAGATLRADAN
jgi:two-component system, NtrC family, response regulator AtoC